MSDRPPPKPLYEEALRRLSESREAVDGGDGLAVLYALRICVRDGLPVPDWLTNAFMPVRSFCGKFRLAILTPAANSLPK
jgi:hypothetical protein